MSAAKLDKVLNHLRDIARRSLDTAGDIAAKRALVDEYINVHPSVLEYDAIVEPVEIQHIKGEWLTTENTNPGNRLLYIHGGSWMAGRIEIYRPFIARLARATACAVLAIDYRLTPEHPFPAGLDDCVMGFNFMCANGPGGYADLNTCFIAGDSAGGNLALASLLVMKDKNLSMPDGAIALSAATDLTWSGDSIHTRAAVEPALNPVLMPLLTGIYLQNGEPAEHPYASPLFADLVSLPPMLLQVGDAEILLDDSTRFAERARAAGCDMTLEIYEHMPHVFQVFSPYLPQASKALANMGKFTSRFF